jgi:uncharacterized membrane protein YhaH (DUF805 family)
VAVYIETFEKSFDFEGRSTRTEFWVFFFGTVLLALPLVVLDVVMETYNPEIGLGPFTGLFLILGFIPSISLSVRRLHDADFSGWWFFIGLVPIAGPIIQLILLVLNGTEGANRFGADPRSPGVKSDI